MYCNFEQFTNLLTLTKNNSRNVFGRGTFVQVKHSSVLNRKYFQTLLCNNRKHTVLKILVESLCQNMLRNWQKKVNGNGKT